MEGVTVHKLSENLVVSVIPLPGFKILGTCVVRDENGDKSGLVTIYYVGDFFASTRPAVEFTKMHREVMRLAQNYAIKTKLGVATTRLNLASANRPKEFRNSTIPRESRHENMEQLPATA
jgi:hypothetical protein